MSDAPPSDEGQNELPQLDQADWAWLKPHAERDMLILVDRSLDLMVVAQAVARDEKAQVAEWITRRLIAKPTPEQLAEWEAERRFLFSIVQPFVLAQEGAIH